MTELAGKNALVTGGSRGIGAAVAIALADSGADVAITYNSSPEDAAAVVGMNKGLARDLGGRGITSNVVQPGPIDTSMNPADGPYAPAQRSYLALDRFGTVDEVAAAVLYLAGPSGSYVTGTELTIDGGHAA